MQIKNSKSVHLFQINGVGIDLTKFHPVSEEEKRQLRVQFGYANTDFILLYIAEFIPRKNHIFLLNQIKIVKQSIPNIRIILAGTGKLFEKCKKKSEMLKVSKIIDFLGYRNDIDNLCQMADIYITSSKQEGLPISILEAMACGLPVVCSKIRGHTDVIVHGRNGFLFELPKSLEMVNSVITLYNNPELRQAISHNNIYDAKNFSMDTAIVKMAEIYKRFMPSTE